MSLYCSICGTSYGGHNVMWPVGVNGLRDSPYYEELHLLYAARGYIWLCYKCTAPILSDVLNIGTVQTV